MGPSPGLNVPLTSGGGENESCNNSWEVKETVNESEEADALLAKTAPVLELNESTAISRNSSMPCINSSMVLEANETVIPVSGQENILPDVNNKVNTSVIITISLENSTVVAANTT